MGLEMFVKDKVLIYNNFMKLSLFIQDFFEVLQGCNLPCSHLAKITCLLHKSKLETEIMFLIF